MAQLMPLPLTVSCFSKIQIGFTFLVPTHPGSPGQRAVKRVCVCVLCCSLAISIIVSCGVFVWTLCTGAGGTFWILENFSEPLCRLQGTGAHGVWKCCIACFDRTWHLTVECRWSTWLYEPFNTAFDYLYELVSRVCGTLHLYYCHVYICLTVYV